MEVLCLVAVAKGGDDISSTGARVARGSLDENDSVDGDRTSGKRTAEEEAGHLVVRPAWVCLQCRRRKCKVRKLSHHSSQISQGGNGKEDHAEMVGRPLIDRDKVRSFNRSDQVLLTWR